MLNRLLLVALLWGIAGAASAQIMMVNVGDTVSITPGTSVSVIGGVWNKPAGAFYNQDTLYITDTLRNQGGNEMFHNSLNGTVVLCGNDQLIEGPDVIRFSTLKTWGGGTKSMAINILIEDSLDLWQRELDTRVDTAFVLNPDPAIITRIDGFVSSDLGGSLARAVDRTQVYLFPVGDSLPTFRYRPIEVRPVAAQADTFYVRFAHVDATTQGFDRNVKDTSICIINPDFFHHIRGASAADLRVYYDPAADPVHELLAQWRQVPHWTEIGRIQTPGSPLSSVGVDNWSDFAQEAFALAHPRPDVKLDSIQPDVCTNGNPIILRGTPLGGHYFANGTPLADSVFNPGAFPAGTYIIEYVYADTLTGGLITCPDTARRTLVVKQAPRSTITAGGPTEFCDGGSVTLTAQPQGPQYVYNWSTGETTPSIVVRQTGNYFVSIIDTTLDCDSTSLSIPVRVNPNPPANLTLSGDTVLCDGQTLTITAPAGPSFAYLWSTGATTPSITVGTPGGYFVTITDTSRPTACATTSRTVTVDVIYKPVAGISFAGDTLLCQGGTVTLTATPGGLLYDWFRNGQALFPAPVPQNSLTVTQSGIYNVVVINTCSVSDTSDTARITIFNAPTADFAYQPDSANIEIPFQFTDLSTADSLQGDQVVAWFWDFGDGNTSTDRNPTHAYPTKGDYTVTLRITTANGCTDTVSYVVRVYNFFKIYIPSAFSPNGDGQNDEFEVKGDGVATYEAYIYDRWGLLVWQSNSFTEHWRGFTTNGGLCPEDVYVYLIRAFSYDKRAFEGTGTVTLIR